MAYNAKILADSLSPKKFRLTTFEITFPRFILAEFNTHRMLSRSTASSRAIPVNKVIKMVKEDPYIPEFEKNVPGMQSYDLLDFDEMQEARLAWLEQRDDAVRIAERLIALGVHKHFANRLLEPFSWVTTITSATDWVNFFALRCHKDAQPEFRRIAKMMYTLYMKNKPQQLQAGEWHLPLINQEDVLEFGKPSSKDHPLIKISAGRCARASYLTHDGKRDPQEDIKLHDKLIINEPRHSSPCEHQAMSTNSDTYYGNFIGFQQYRKLISDENITNLSKVYVG